MKHIVMFLAGCLLSPVAFGSCPPPPRFTATFQPVECCEPADCDLSMIASQPIEVEGTTFGCTREHVWNAIRISDHSGVVVLGYIRTFEVIDNGWTEGFGSSPDLDLPLAIPEKVFLGQFASCDELKTTETVELQLTYACCDVLCDDSVPCAFTSIVGYVSGSK